MNKKILILFSILFLTACVHHNQLVPVKPFAPTNHENQNSLVTELRQQNVQVIHLGETWRLVLETDYFFQPNKTQLKNQSVSTMISIASLIQRVNPVGEIEVTGYTDNIGGQNQQKVRAKQYANTVAAYLWAQGIPYHKLVIRGAGNRNKIATNHTSQGKSFNRRVEITFNN